MTTPTLTTIVLAAGKGKRLRSQLPKVIHKVAGRSLVAHVLDVVWVLGSQRVAIVVSKDGDPVRDAVGEAGFGDIDFVVQDPPNGTADAVRIAIAELGISDGHVLVVNGDMPLVRGETLQGLIDRAIGEGVAAAVLTASVDEPGDLGRVVRADDGSLARIVEARDATDEELEITEINCGAYVFDAALLALSIEKVDRENAQGEFYLTDVVQLFVSEGQRVEAHEASAEEGSGVNDRAGLSEVGALLRMRICQR